MIDTSLDDLFDDIEATYPNFEREEYTSDTVQLDRVSQTLGQSGTLTAWIAMVYNFLVCAIDVEIGEEWSKQLTFSDLLLIKSNGFLEYFSERIYSTSIVANKTRHCWDIIDAFVSSDDDDTGFPTTKGPPSIMFARAMTSLDSLVSRLILDYARIADRHLEIYRSSNSSGSEDELRRPDLLSRVDAVQDVLENNANGLTYRSRKVLVKFLYKAARKHGVLPKKFHLPDVKKVDEFPFGCGSFGDVYKGKIGGQKVAVKICRFFWEPEMKEERCREICREAFIWKPLEHPNVLPFLGICTDGFPSVGLVSPFMDNGNLMGYMKRNKDMNKLDVVKQICSGLSYLHSSKPEVVHGDLKCANILVDDVGRPQIADFGLARAISMSSITASIKAKGTLRWQAPELVYPGVSSGDGRVNTKTDVYAFGMTCLEILKEDVPFRNKTDWEVLTMARDGTALECALESAKDCTWVSEILRLCCNAEPDSRLRATDILQTVTQSENLSRTVHTENGTLPVPPPRVPRRKIKVNIPLGMNRMDLTA